MDAANVGKLTLKRFDGLHFIPSIKLYKFSVSSNGFASLSNFVIEQKRESAFLLQGYKTRKTLNYFLISERFNFKCQRKKGQLKLLIDSKCLSIHY